MRKTILTVAAFLLFAAPPAFAGKAEDAAALAPVHQFIDATNKGDMKAGAASFAPGASIIDEFAPYHWQGDNAFAQWSADFDAQAKAGAITDGVIALEAPHRVLLTAAHGYAVIPARYDFKDHGHPVHERGTFTFALTQTAQGWRIAAWSWAWRSQ